MQWFRRLWSAATGAGLSRNIADCYEAIIKHYEPGDRIFLFGFSRGAFTARCVGGVLSLCGVPSQADGGGPVPRHGKALRRIADEAVERVYEHGNGKADRDGEFKRQRLELARRFRKTYGCAECQNEAGTAVQAADVPYFIGVFDTVAAVGAKGKRQLAFMLLLELFLAVVSMVVAGIAVVFAPVAYFWQIAAGINLVLILLIMGQELRNRFKWISRFEGRRFRWHFAAWNYRFHDRDLNRNVRHARHALAIDESRADFDRVPWGVPGRAPVRDGEPEWLRQWWFAGNHSDIGGSYPEDESRLSDIALKWMIDQATEVRFPLQLDRSKLRLFPDARGMQHSEVQRAAESRLAFLVRWKEKDRKIPDGAPLHLTVKERFGHETVSHYGVHRPYRPANLQDHVELRRPSGGAEAPSLP